MMQIQKKYILIICVSKSLLYIICVCVDAY